MNCIQFIFIFNLHSHTHKNKIWNCTREKMQLLMLDSFFAFIFFISVFVFVLCWCTLWNDDWMRFWQSHIDFNWKQVRWMNEELTKSSKMKSQLLNEIYYKAFRRSSSNDCGGMVKRMKWIRMKKINGILYRVTEYRTCQIHHSGIFPFEIHQGEFVLLLCCQWHGAGCAKQ